jgi:hypothetical protein
LSPLLILPQVHFGHKSNFATCNTYVAAGLRLNCGRGGGFAEFKQQSSFRCLAPARFGSHDDGGWNLCLDALPVDRNQCLVYSFGIGNESSFDFAAAADGCEVMMFDPSIGEAEQTIAKNMRFMPLGLANSEHIAENGWAMGTLDSVVQKAGHSGRSISVLKLDIEGHEWKTLPGLIDSSWFREGKVKQLLIEAHFSQERAAEQFAVLGKLESLGYHVFAMDENWRYSDVIQVNGRFVLDCLEISFVYKGDGKVPLASVEMQPSNPYWHREKKRNEQRTL